MRVNLRGFINEFTKSCQISVVTPAKAGVQKNPKKLDANASPGPRSGVHRHDGEMMETYFR